MQRTQKFQRKNSRAKNVLGSLISRFIEFQAQKVPESVEIQSLIGKMDATHIFLKELEIDEDGTFTANFTKENEVENVVFSKDTEYPITGLSINSILSDEKLLKIENLKEQTKV